MANCLPVLSGTLVTSLLNCKCENDTSESMRFSLGFVMWNGFEYATWIPYGDCPRWNVMGDDAACPNDGIVPYGDSRKDGDASTNPDIIPDRDGLGCFYAGVALLWA